MRVLIYLDCTVCKNRNYRRDKNRTKTSEKIQLKKFCRGCRKHTSHKEGK